MVIHPFTFYRMRFPLSILQRTRLRFHQPVDIYRHCEFPTRQRTMEHIIPVRVLSENRSMQHDPLNLYTTSAEMNRFRSDYRFGGIEDQVRQEKWASMEHVCFRNPRRRVFYPHHSRRLIAHVLWKMMDKYPSLRDEETQTQIIESTETWNRWLQTPWTPMEKHLLENNDRLLD